MAFPIPNPPIDQIDIDTVRLVEPVNLSLAPDPRHNVHFYAVWRQIGGVVPLAGTWSKLNDFHQCSFEVLSRMIFNVFEIQQQQVMGPNNQIIAINWDGNLQNLYFVFVNVETNFTTNEKRLVVNRALGFRCAESPNLPIPNCSIAICTYDAVGNRFRPVVMQHCEVGYRVRTYTATVDSKKRPGTKEAVLES
ncbi:hypothetical protein SISSUDRAFT_710271 [Sistotremastrum suecicum HHB10207 ss-3]|uniref:Uncharacterized protein n=1 Tax=Sistotremastrum suecicum HHB10207 ss-3 TaxID=1314776 RepID=A0A166DRF5_9AGAM|nr:hypothetical protein SISSUDRAFT_710271 [Sistotremastrum suecicum HHB10207 ss-3]